MLPEATLAEAGTGRLFMLKPCRWTNLGKATKEIDLTVDDSMLQGEEEISKRSNYENGNQTKHIIEQASRDEDESSVVTKSASRPGNNG